MSTGGIIDFQGANKEPREAKNLVIKDYDNRLKALEEGGGSSVEVVQTTGESTTAVMSQKATTDAIEAGGGSSVEVMQTTGQSTTAVMSQKATTDAIAVAAIKTLTTDDYNFPEDNPTSIAMWNLPDGIYRNSTGSTLPFYSAGNKRNDILNGEILIVTTSGEYCKAFVIRQSSGTVTVFGCYKNSTHEELPFSYYGDYIDAGAVLVVGSIADNLTTNRSQRPLSARQGKVLDEKIGDLATLTTTAKSSVVEAINELATRIGTLEGN